MLLYNYVTNISQIFHKYLPSFERERKRTREIREQARKEVKQ